MSSTAFTNPAFPPAHGNSGIIPPQSVLFCSHLEQANYYKQLMDAGMHLSLLGDAMITTSVISGKKKSAEMLRIRRRSLRDHKIP